ncbi:hypothetical protein Hanom_Chr00s000001g01597551 [Helianthus anomalus]
MCPRPAPLMHACASLAHFHVPHAWFTCHLVLAAHVLHHACAVENTKAARVCFCETLRMECSHLNISLSFISPPMWDNVSFSHYFSIKCFKHQTLSIDVSFILASFWTRFSFCEAFPR